MSLQQSKSSHPFIYYTLLSILPFLVFISVPRGVLPQVITHQASGFMCHPSKVPYTNLPSFHIAITKSPSFLYFVTETMATHEKCYAIKRWQEFISPLWINHRVISDGYCRAWTQISIIFRLRPDGRSVSHAITPNVFCDLKLQGALISRTSLYI